MLAKSKNNTIRPTYSGAKASQSIPGDETSTLFPWPCYLMSISSRPTSSAFQALRAKVNNTSMQRNGWQTVHNPAWPGIWLPLRGQESSQSNAGVNRSAWSFDWHDAKHSLVKSCLPSIRNTWAPFFHLNTTAKKPLHGSEIIAMENVDQPAAVDLKKPNGSPIERNEGIRIGPRGPVSSCARFCVFWSKGQPMPLEIVSLEPQSPGGTPAGTPEVCQMRFTAPRRATAHWACTSFHQSASPVVCNEYNELRIAGGAASSRVSRDRGGDGDRQQAAAMSVL